MKTKSNTKIIGVTGKSGAGKGYIIKKLAQNTDNIYVIDADSVYHDMLKKSELKTSIISAFGHNIVDEAGEINRKKLAAIAFSGEENIEKLNKATLPLVVEEIQNIIEGLKQKEAEIIYLDAPTLIESGIYSICDEIIFVKSAKDVRKKRIIERDNLTDEEAEQRMRFEKNDEFYLKYANKVIEN